jgi:hypothetical protein
MGCDIHLFTEYYDPSVKYNYNGKLWRALNWHSINPGRNYELFAKLSSVRGHNDNPIANAGWPEDASWGAKYSNQISIRDVTGNGKEGVLVGEAKRWVESGSSKYIQDETGKNIAVTHPDWHNHGHCTVAQMSKALRGNSSPEYRALLAAARSLEKDGMEVRFLFYYDN